MLNGTSLQIRQIKTHQSPKKFCNFPKFLPPPQNYPLYGIHHIIVCVCVCVCMCHMIVVRLFLCLHHTSLYLSDTGFYTHTHTSVVLVAGMTFHFSLVTLYIQL